MSKIRLVKNIKSRNKAKIAESTGSDSDKDKVNIPETPKVKAMYSAKLLRLLGAP